MASAFRETAFGLPGRLLVASGLACPVIYATGFSHVVAQAAERARRSLAPAS
ncbi:MAG: hypothetical protein MRJ92_02770 [Nitrospira sp.]|nr:hypothetical protein [Nitrospira sp.]